MDINCSPLCWDNYQDYVDVHKVDISDVVVSENIYFVTKLPHAKIRISEQHHLFPSIKAGVWSLPSLLRLLLAY